MGTFSLISTCLIRPASYPGVSLSRWKCARKRRREGDNCTLSMVPCDSSPVSQVSRSILPCEEQSAWGGGWGLTLLQKKYLQHRKFLESYVELSGPSGSLHRKRLLLLFAASFWWGCEMSAMILGFGNPSTIALRVESRIQVPPRKTLIQYLESGIHGCSVNRGAGGSPDHRSLPFAEYECLWSRIFCAEESRCFPGQ